MTLPVLRCIEPSAVKLDDSCKSQVFQACSLNQDFAAINLDRAHQ
jgi:hypothetical protein